MSNVIENLIVAGIANQKVVNLTWQASLDAVKYLVEIGGKKYTTKKTSIALKKLAAGPQTVSVSALDKAGNIVAKKSLPFNVADITAPKKGKVKLAQLGPNSISISMSNFNDNVGVAKYNIYLNSKLIATTNKASYVYQGNLGGKMTFAIEAVDAVGNVSKKVKSSIKVKDMVAPDKVVKLNVVGATQKSTTITWAAATDNVKVTGYEITIDGKTYKSKKASLTVKKLAAGEHTVTVVAVDKAKNKSVVSNTYTFNVADSTAPKNGKVKLTQLDKSSIKFNMTGFSDNVAVSYYNIYLNGKLVATSKTANYTYKNDKIGGKMTFKVEAVDAAGNKSKQVKSSITVKDMVAPSQVKNVRLIGKATKKSTTITWDAATDNVGVTSYIVTVGKKSYTTKKNSLTLTNLAEGNNYVYVRALDKAKNISDESSLLVPIPIYKELNVKEAETIRGTEGNDTIIVSGKNVNCDGGIDLGGGNDTLIIDKKSSLAIKNIFHFGDGDDIIQINPDSNVKFIIGNIGWYSNMGSGNDALILKENSYCEIKGDIEFDDGDDLLQIDAGAVMKMAVNAGRMGDGNDTWIINGKLVLTNGYISDIDNISGTGSIYLLDGSDISSDFLQKVQDAGIKVYQIPDGWDYTDVGNEHQDDFLETATLLKRGQENKVWLDAYENISGIIDTEDWFKLEIGGAGNITASDKILINSELSDRYPCDIDVYDKNGNYMRELTINKYGYGSTYDLNLSNGTYYLKFHPDSFYGYTAITFTIGNK